MVEEKEQLIRDCYDFCGRAGNNSQAIISFAKARNISVSMVRKYADLYYLYEPTSLEIILKKILEANKIHYNDWYALFYNLIPATNSDKVRSVIKNSNIDVMNGSFYSQLNDKLDEFSNQCLRKLNSQIRLDIIMMMKERINEYVSYMNKKMELQLEEKCYDFCFREKFDESKIKVFSFTVLLSIEEVLEYARMYAIDVLNISEDGYIQSQVMAAFGDSYVGFDKVIEALIKANDQKEVDLILDEIDIKDFSILINFVDQYVFMTRTNLNRYKKFALMNEIVSKIKQYVDNSKVHGVKKTFNDEDTKIETEKKLDVAEQTVKAKEVVVDKMKREVSNLPISTKKPLTKEEFEKLPYAISLIKFFLVTGLTSQSRFCLAYDIDRDMFKKYLDIVKRQDGALFDKYNGRVSGVTPMNQNELKDDISKIAKYICESAITMPNGNKKIVFSLLDYYLTTAINIEALKDMSVTYSGLSFEEKTLLKKFIVLNTNDEILDLNDNRIKSILETYDEIGVKFDNKNNPIKGSGRVIRKEEKEKIIDYLRKNLMPMNYRTYSAAYRKYIKGELDFGKKSKARERKKIY